jgi:hypothetical protein
VAGELLLDTGALVALLDRSQAEHAACVTFFEEWEGRVVTTEAVLTEATHLLGRVHGGQDKCLAFVVQGGAVLVPSSAASLERCRKLMQRYSDVPMDFADATLVALAEEIGTNSVFTTDRHDFAIYRAKGKTPFRILP